MTNVVRFNSESALPSIPSLRDPAKVALMLERLDEIRAKIERGEIAAFVAAAVGHDNETYVFQSGDGTIGSLTMFGALNYVCQRYWEDE